jgi:hypothetical protein
MTTFRYSLLGALVLVGLLVALLASKGSEESAAKAAAAISAQCGISVQARRNEANGQLGLAIDPVHLACPAEGDSVGIACARKRIAASHFSEEVKAPPLETCPKESTR